MTTEQYQALLRSMTGELPETKIGLIRCLLPEIEAAVATGHTLTAIWRRLHRKGVKMSRWQFYNCVRTARSDPGQAATQKGRKGSAESAPTRFNRGANLRGAVFDLMANVREREGCRPGFEWKGTRSAEELVHG